jgi:hypothetical protein
MTDNNFWQFNFSSMIALISASVTIVGWLYFGITWKADIDRKMKIIWEMFVEPMMKKAFSDQLIMRNSPLRLDVTVLERHPVYEKIKAFYVADGQKLDDWELLSQIKRRFGPELAAAARAEGKTEEGFEVAALFLVRPKIELFNELDANHNWGKKDDDG